MTRAEVLNFQDKKHAFHQETETISHLEAQLKMRQHGKLSTLITRRAADIT